MEIAETAVATASKAIPASGWRRWINSALPWTLLFFCATFVLTLQHNRSPYYYEKDAPSKVAQVLNGERNFFHPLLMLNATDVAMRAAGVPRTKQAAVVVGRTCGAAFTAVAVAAFAALGFRWAGHAGALCGGALVMTQSLVFELAHYMKEDPALLMGVALSFVAMQWFWEKRTTSSAAWMGAACGVALSGKYVGIAMGIIAIVLLFLAPGDRSRNHWLAFFSAFLVVTVLINWQLVVESNQFRAGFASELKRETGRAEKVAQIPHVAKTMDVIRNYVPRLLGCLAFVPIGLAVWRRNHSRAVIIAMAAYCVVFLGVLMFSPRLFTRHFLPIVASVAFLSGIAIAQFVPLALQVTRLRGQRVLGFALTVAALCVIYFTNHHRRLIATYDSFSNPTPEQLIAFVQKNVPPDAVIAADERLYLRDPEGQIRDDAPVLQTVLVRQQLGDFGTIDDLVRQGVTYVAAHRVSSEPLFLSKSKAKSGAGRKRHEKSKGFYADLQKFGELVWEVQNGESGYTAPAIRLYRLRAERTGSVDIP